MTQPSPSRKRTGFPVAAGVLVILASCVAAFIGVIELVVALLFASGYYGIIWMFMVASGILGFIFGLTGGILSIGRRRFVLSIVSVSLVIVSGFVIFLAPALFGSMRIGMLFGVPIIVLSVLSLIFISASKDEFT